MRQSPWPFRSFASPDYIHYSHVDHQHVGVCRKRKVSFDIYTSQGSHNFKVCMLRQPQDLNYRPGHFGSATLLLGAPWGVYGLTLVAQPQHAAQSRPQPKAVPIIVLFSHQARLQPWLRSTAVVLAVHARVSHRTEPSAAPAQRFVICAMFDNALQDSMLRDRKMCLFPQILWNGVRWIITNICCILWGAQRAWLARVRDVIMFCVLRTIAQHVFSIICFARVT